MKGSEIIFKNKKQFHITLVIFTIYVVLSFPFFHENFPESNVFIFNISINSWDGLNYLGIIALILLFTSLTLAVKSLNQFKKRTVLIGILLATFIPQYLADAYKKTLATGVYAISYKQEFSECDIRKNGDTTLVAECNLMLTNHSNSDVELLLSFIDKYNDEEHDMIKIVNNGAPYNLKLHKNESKHVEIYSTIDASRLEEAMDTGNMKMLNIKIESDGKERKL
ncbi:hypothetical protein [Oceanobacillus kimchii]|uniref:hypothetical protein n=1 Tax=Oceanobacillus kimchii TaxID=746691 RepID=UPI0009859273|nr:hypothetical protein [Oceanobacillus kimchii]